MNTFSLLRTIFYGILTVEYGFCVSHDRFKRKRDIEGNGEYLSGAYSKKLCDPNA